MNELKIFENQEFGEIRTVMVGEEPYFVGKDVATALGYRNGSRDINRHVDNEDKKEMMIPQYPSGTLVSKAIVINESGLYSLIFSSRLPKAKEFKRWVTNEVLPSIRKHGMYATEELLGNPEFAIATFTRLRDEMEKRKQLEIEVEENKQKMIELKPKIEYVDNVLSAKNTMTVRQIAADYGLTAQQLNKILHEQEVQYKVGGQWVLYKDKAGRGYTKSITYAVPNSYGGVITNTQTRWTQKGRKYIDKVLAECGVRINK